MWTGRAWAEVGIECGKPIQASLCTADQVDTYSFVLAGTAGVSVQASDRFGTIGLLRLRLENEAGEVVAETCRGRIEMPLRLGSYRLRVSDCIGGASGDYTVMMLVDRRPGQPTELAATRDGSLVYVAMGSSNAVAVYDFSVPSRPQLLDHFPAGKAPLAVRLSADETRAFVVDWQGDAVLVIDTLSRQVLSTFPVATSPRDAVVSADGSQLYVMSCNGFCYSPPYEMEGALGIIDPNAPPPIDVPDFGSAIGDVHLWGGSGLALSPDESRIYVLASGDGYVLVGDTQSAQIIAEIPVRSRPPFEASQGIVVSPDGRLLYALDSETGLSVIDTDRMAVDGRIDFAEPDFSGMRIRLNDIEVSPDGDLLYVAFDTPDSRLSWLWAVDTQTRETVAVYYIAPGTVPSVALAQEGTRAYCTTEQSQGGTITALQLPGGVPLSSFSTSGASACTPFSNDRCDQAKEITGESFVGYLDAGSMSAASRDSGDPVPLACAERREYPANVWYRFIAPADGVVVADTLGSTFDSILVAYRGSCGTLEEIACNDNAQIEHFGAFTPSLLTTPVRGGETYSFVVHGYGNFGLGSFSLVFQPDDRASLASPVISCGRPQTSGRESCAGDCDGDGEVMVSELVLALDQSLSGLDECLAADSDADGIVSITDLVRAVGSALEGCGK